MHFIINHVITFFFLTYTNVYCVISALTSKRFQDSKNANCRWFDVEVHFTRYNTKIGYIK